MKGLDVPEYDLEGVKGKIHTRWEVIIPPFGHCSKGYYKLDDTFKILIIVVEPVMGYFKHIATARSYGVLKPGRGKIDVFLRKHSAKQITLPKQTAVVEIAAANIIPALLAPSQQGMRQVRMKPLQRKGNLKVKKNY